MWTSRQTKKLNRFSCEYFLALHSQTSIPPETSSMLRPEEPKSDDSDRFEDDPLGLPT